MKVEKNGNFSSIILDENERSRLISSIQNELKKLGWSNPYDKDFSGNVFKMLVWIQYLTRESDKIMIDYMNDEDVKMIYSFLGIDHFHEYENSEELDLIEIDMIMKSMKNILNS